MTQKEGINAFAAQISKGPLGLAHYRPEPWAKVNHCFDNVIEKVRCAGSRPVTGWTFNIHENVEFGMYLAATHHCVWLSQNQSLIDVTPFHENPKLRPITRDGDVLFLIDLDASPIISTVDDCEIVAPRPIRFFPLTGEENLVRYVQGLAVRQQLNCKEFYGGRIS